MDLAPAGLSSVKLGYTPGLRVSEKELTLKLVNQFRLHFLSLLGDDALQFAQRRYILELLWGKRKMSPPSVLFFCSFVSLFLSLNHVDMRRPRASAKCQQ